MAIPSAIMAITSAKLVVILSATKNKTKKQTLAVSIGVPIATWQLHQPNCGNSISHCGININHYNYVTFHLSQLLPQKWNSLSTNTCDHNICHKGINQWP